MKVFIECRLSNGVRPDEFGYRFFEADGSLRVGVGPRGACRSRDGWPFAPGECLDDESTPGLVAGTLLGRSGPEATIAVVDLLSEMGLTIVRVEMDRDYYRTASDQRWLEALV